MIVGESMSFTPVIRTSKSVLKTIYEFAKERKLDPKDLEFELLSYETLVKNSIDEEYRVLQPAQILCEDELLDPMISIIQEYRIKIFSKEELTTISTIHLSLASDKLKIRAVATFEAGTVLVGHKGVLKELRDAVWKKKLLAGFFIDFFETNMLQQLKKLVTFVGFNKPLEKDIKFSIAQGINPQPPVDAKLVKLYEESQKANNLIEAVKTDTLVLRYIKPKAGADGRGCDAKYIKVRESRVIDSKPIVDASVRVVEEEDEILYYAATDGYITWKGENFGLFKTLVLEHANFKSSSNIDAGENKDITVHIGGKQDSAEDAIGRGVKIDVKELSVEGSIGSNVNISANDLNVGAQTHRKSKIEVANIANIRLHRGDLQAREANIEILEVGKVTTEKLINIKQMLGGEAIAPIVKVDEVLSNCVIMASELIEIGNINGGGVKLIIDPSSMQSYHKELEEILGRLKVLSAQLRIQKEEFQKDQKEHLLGIERVKRFQLKIVQAQKAGQEPMKQDIIRVRQYKKALEELKQREAQIVQDELALERLEVQQERLYKQDLHAKIVHHGVYDGHTQIIFIDPKTQEKTTISPVGKRRL